MMLTTVAEFDEIVATQRMKGPPPHWKAGEMPEIAVPSGPISHW